MKAGCVDRVGESLNDSAEKREAENEFRRPFLAPDAEMARESTDGGGL